MILNNKKLFLIINKIRKPEIETFFCVIVRIKKLSINF